VDNRHLPASAFLDSEESQAATQYMERGYIISPVESLHQLNRIRDLAAYTAAEYLHLETPANPDEFLNSIHQHVQGQHLNGLRLRVIQRINQAAWIRPAYFHLARRLLSHIAGSELAMQMRLNLSVQLPADEGSLLPIHADTWSGDSPFEVVLWVPLVDCYGTKAMFLLPPEPARALNDNFPLDSSSSSEQLYANVESSLAWIDIKYGEVLLFNQNLPHGNRVNTEKETRWSMNCRFKGVFTPYADKRLGEFFEPITLRPASRIGLDYRPPAMKARQGDAE
jgi:sporadic carbohydrate cluster 2OG-Fe(II) oxygenase